MKRSIFRKLSLEHLSSPEQLDQIIEITTVKAWYVLMGIGLIVATVFLWGIYGGIEVKTYGKGILMQGTGVYQVTYGRRGQVISLYAVPGQEVKKGDFLGLIEDSETKEREMVVAPANGRILEIPVHIRAYIDPYETVMSIEGRNTYSNAMHVVAYIPLEDGKRLEVGMPVNIEPTTFKSAEYGTLIGEVVSISPYAVTREGMYAKLGNDMLIESIGNGQPHVEVSIALQEDYTPSGYKWTTRSGPPSTLKSGTLCDVAIAIEEKKPIQLLLP